MISIKVMRAAGLTDAQILRVIEEHRVERREYERLKKQRQRARVPNVPGDSEGQWGHPPLSKKERKKIYKKDKPSYISDDWNPSEADVRYARSKGWDDARIATEAERFAVHYRMSKAKWTDWHLVWCKWVISPFQTKASGNGRPYHPTYKDRRQEELEDAKQCLDDFARASVAGDLGGAVAPDDGELPFAKRA